MKNLFYGKTKFGQKPITLENILEVEGYVKSGIKTFKFLKDANGLPLISGPWQIFVIGFYISALSILSISKNLLQWSEIQFKYGLTDHISQNQLEMHCAKVRTCFGWNSSSTALQFKYAIRQLLLKNKTESPLLLTAFMSHQMIKMRWVKSTQECQSSCYQPLVGTQMFYITSLDTLLKSSLSL